MVCIDSAKFEQLKKQKGKASKSGSAKKKDEQPSSADKDGALEDAAEVPPLSRAEGEEEKPPADEDGAAEDRSPKETSETPAKSLHNRAPSLSVQSKMRSSSFRRTSLSQGPLSPNANGTRSPDLPALSPDGDSVNSIYRKQAARLDELEKENRRLAKEAQDAEKKWKKTEEEIEELREISGEVAELKSRAQKLDAQTDELNRMV